MRIETQSFNPQEVRCYCTYSFGLFLFLRLLRVQYIISTFTSTVTMVSVLYMFTLLIIGQAYDSQCLYLLFSCFLSVLVACQSSSTL